MANLCVYPPATDCKDTVAEVLWANRVGVLANRMFVPVMPEVPRTISDAAPSLIWMTDPVVGDPMDADAVSWVAPAAMADARVGAVPKVPLDVEDMSPKTLSSMNPSMSRNMGPPNEKVAFWTPRISLNNGVMTPRIASSGRNLGVSSGL